jgi:hypothetical protein
MKTEANNGSKSLCRSWRRHQFYRPRARLVACSPFWAPWAKALGAWIAPCDAKTNLVVLFGWLRYTVSHMRGNAACSVWLLAVNHFMQHSHCLVATQASDLVTSSLKRWTYPAHSTQRWTTLNYQFIMVMDASRATPKNQQLMMHHKFISRVVLVPPPKILQVWHEVFISS